MCNYLKLESIALFCLVAFLAGCGGSGSESPPEPQPPPARTISVDVGVKQLIFSWIGRADVRWDAIYFKLLENADGHSGFTQVGDDILAEKSSVRRDIAVHLFDFANALYILEACNNYLCSRSTEFNFINGMLDAVGYFKASNTGVSDVFGYVVALSADGNTMAVTAKNEASNATGIDGDQSDNSATQSGAVYIFRSDGMIWSQQAYVKASNTGSGDLFGESLALSADGNLLAVGAAREDSNASGINGDQINNSAISAGAVYIFRFDGMGWSQRAYIKAANTDADDLFGSSVSLSADGNTLAVGARKEGSNAIGVNGDANDNSAPESGATYIFRFDGVDWTQHDYLKASNSGPDDWFGFFTALSDDGNTLAVAALYESSSATGISGDQSDDSADRSGAVYVFRFDGATWSQQAYVKASNTDPDDQFGTAVTLSGDGNTLAIGATNESSGAIVINGNQNDNTLSQTGAAYVFRFDGTSWSQQAYVKASNAGEHDIFGRTVVLNSDGNVLVVSASGEDSGATGIGGDQNDNSGNSNGAVYIFRFDEMSWSQQSYVKAPNTGAADVFGNSVALSADGNTLAVGSPQKMSNATGVGGDQNDDSIDQAGAAYLY